jgi:hypothetical protein
MQQDEGRTAGLPNPFRVIFFGAAALERAPRPLPVGAPVK